MPSLGRPTPSSRSREALARPPPCSEIAQFYKTAFGRRVMLHYRPPLIEDKNPLDFGEDLLVGETSCIHGYIIPE